MALAREIAKRVNAKLIAISSTKNAEKIHVSAKTVGIIFPSYLAAVIGMPLIVDRFIKKIDNLDSLRIFAVCTCGGDESVNALPSLKKLEHTIRSCGEKLSAGYSVRLPTCDEWCSTGAIRHWSRSKGTKYHYPDISISDMLASKNGHSGIVSPGYRQTMLKRELDL